jgi:hypothetical protein
MFLSPNLLSCVFVRETPRSEPRCQKFVIGRQRASTSADTIAMGARNTTLSSDTSSSILNGWVTTKVDCSHGFKELPAERDEDIEVDFNSPGFECFGHRWHLHVDGDDDEFGVRLRHSSKGKIDVLFNLRMINFEGRLLANVIGNRCKFDGERSQVPVPGSGGRHQYSFPLIVKLSKIAEFATRGVLVIEVQMKRVDTSYSSLPFIPENPSACKTVRDLYMDEESSDIAFEVCQQAGRNNAHKVARIEPASFYAHRMIVQKCSTTLAELCEAGRDRMRPIQITDVSPTVFRHLLNYVYGGQVSAGEMKLHAKEIIDASDKYGIPYLKLEAEACLVGTTTFSVENIMDHLLYADSKNCALLKEAAIDFIVDTKIEVLKRVSFKDVPGTLVSDVLTAFSRAEGERDDFATLRISDLRRKVHEIGMNVDGSREVLLAILDSRNIMSSQEKNNDEGKEENDDNH